MLIYMMNFFTWNLLTYVCSTSLSICIYIRSEMYQVCAYVRIHVHVHSHTQKKIKPTYIVVPELPSVTMKSSPQIRTVGQYVDHMLCMRVCLCVFF